MGSLVNRPLEIQPSLFAPSETDAREAWVEDNRSTPATGGDVHEFGSSVSGHSSEPTSRQFDELLRIHEHESERFGQELHDSAGQLLVALRLSVARLKRTDADRNHQLLIDEIQETVERIDHEIRSLAFLHYPAEIGDQSLATALHSLALNFAQRTGLHMTFRCVGDQRSADEGVLTALLRITQEALVNIHRHAHASRVRIFLRMDPHRLHLSISDDGVGFPGSATQQTIRGIGLRGMRHRIENLGGLFRIYNLKHGAKIATSVPIA